MFMVMRSFTRLKQKPAAGSALRDDLLTSVTATIGCASN
jgi:hypothetical protein